MAFTFAICFVSRKSGRCACWPCRAIQPVRALRGVQALVITRNHTCLAEIVGSAGKFDSQVGACSFFVFVRREIDSFLAILVFGMRYSAVSSCVCVCVCLCARLCVSGRALPAMPSDGSKAQSINGAEQLLDLQFVLDMCMLIAILSILCLFGASGQLGVRMLCLGPNVKAEGADQSAGKSVG